MTDHLTPLSQETHRLLHVLWSKAKDAPGYNKREWQRLETCIGFLTEFLEQQGMNTSEIGKEMLTQDNAITAEPIFLVQQTHRVYGIELDRVDDNVVWLDGDGDEVDPDELREKAGKFPDTWRKVGFLEMKVYVQPFFTRAAAEAFIAANRINLFEPTIYVDSGHRNPEWKAVRKSLMCMGKAS